MELTVLVYYLTYYLQLIVCITLNIGLEGFLCNNLIGERLDLYLDLEGISLEDH